MLIIVLLLFDDTTLYKLYKMKQELHTLELENIKKQNEIIQIKEKTKQLTTNKFALEKFAREHYLMKKMMRLFMSLTVFEIPLTLNNLVK